MRSMYLIKTAAVTSRPTNSNRSIVSFKYYEIAPWESSLIITIIIITLCSGRRNYLGGMTKTQRLATFLSLRSWILISIIQLHEGSPTLDNRVNWASTNHDNVETTLYHLVRGFSKLVLLLLQAMDDLCQCLFFAYGVPQVKAEFPVF